jgi:uncharacterized protein
MATNIFVNLPVKDLNKSKAFFESLGYSFNPQFTDEKAGCLVISETIYCMLITEPFFMTFTKKPIANAKEVTESILALSVDSKEEVDRFVDKAVSLGGKIYRDTDDYGWMYSRSFEDLDGHQWEILYIDINAVPKE